MKDEIVAIGRDKERPQEKDAELSRLKWDIESVLFSISAAFQPLEMIEDICSHLHARRYIFYLQFHFECKCELNGSALNWILELIEL